MAGDKRIPELPRKGAQSSLGSLAIYDAALDETVQIKVQEALGATRFDMDWQADVTYDAGDYVLYNEQTAWKSLVGSNTGNVPAENSFWTAIQISSADGITDTAWAAGLFTYEGSKVIHNNTQYYLQDLAPFESTDIDAEIIAGNWATQAAFAQIAPTGGTYNQLFKSGQWIIELLDATTYTLPLISGLSEEQKSAIHNVKNLSGGAVTLNASGGDLISGQASQAMSDKDNFQLYIDGTNYKIL